MIRLLLIAVCVLPVYAYHLGQLDATEACKAAQQRLRCSYTESSGTGVRIQHVANTCEVYLD